MILIHAALYKEDQMYQTYKLTKSHLNTVHHSSTFLDTLPKKPVFYGEKRKKNAFWKIMENQWKDFFWCREKMKALYETLWKDLALIKINWRKCVSVSYNFFFRGIDSCSIKVLNQGLKHHTIFNLFFIKHNMLNY